jgi:hypothetical protein
MVLTVFSLILDAGVVPPGSGAYPYFVAAQSGLTSALLMCLMINGFVGFQLYEDGTTLSVWLLRLLSLTWFVVVGAISLLTFKGWAGLGPTKTVALFVALYLINGIFLFVYVLTQIILVVNTLQELWPLGDIIFGVGFFVAGQVILYVFSDTICDGVQHYLDGLFFATICNLLGVMMVYKVRPANLPTTLKFCSFIYNSTGIPSLAKISNSVSASNSTTGKSRSLYWKKNEEPPYTQIPITRAASTSNSLA